jgi:hypothetical protein
MRVISSSSSLEARARSIARTSSTPCTFVQRLANSIALDIHTGSVSMIMRFRGAMM